ncbi:hypothetical protein LB505_004023 [Fusarium chuoi]|nr:hypothetical protein LB505_004023 [Fusarium chuoi]
MAEPIRGKRAQDAVAPVASAPSWANLRATSSPCPLPSADVSLVLRASRRITLSSRPSSKKRFSSWRRSTSPSSLLSTRSVPLLSTERLSLPRMRSRPVRRTMSPRLRMLPSLSRSPMSPTTFPVSPSSGSPP